jgi:hypothetical protein
MGSEGGTDASKACARYAGSLAGRLHLGWFAGPDNEKLRGSRCHGQTQRYGPGLGTGGGTGVPVLRPGRHPVRQFRYSKGR